MTLPLLAPDTALFLDIDGTLIEFNDDAEAVRAPEALRATLIALEQRLGGALAVISGRDLPGVDRVFAPLKLAAAGDHGAEARLAASSKAKLLTPENPRPALDAVFAKVRPQLAALPEVRPDPKRFSLAFNYRGARNADAVRSRLNAILNDAVPPGHAALELLPGAASFDVKAKHVNKGTAIQWFLTAPPFRGRVPVYIGDTGTDEDGFAVTCPPDGRAIRVGKPAEGQSTRATEILADPREVRDWLARSAAALA